MHWSDMIVYDAVSIWLEPDEQIVQQQIELESFRHAWLHVLDASPLSSYALICSGQEVHIVATLLQPVCFLFTKLATLSQ